jgi:predicted acyltransferase
LAFILFLSVSIFILSSESEPLCTPFTLTYLNQPMMETKSRYLSLDVLRGMTVTLMIVVNTPGNHATTFAPLLHAQWHGFTLTDLVFPTFMFVVGNAMSFSLVKYASLSGHIHIKKVIKRTAIIFLLGYLMYWFPFVHEQAGQWVASPISQTRIFGVLQRIALGYFFASLILLFWKEKGAFVFSVVALLGYWLIMYAFGDYTLEGNAVLRLDLFLFGAAHLYTGNGIPFDPEGLLSTLPAIVNVIAGYFSGQYIRQRGGSYETIAKLMMAGVCVVFVALSWDMVFPINKKLWTSSFTLYTIGLDLLILPLLLFVIEIKEKRGWTYFFEVFGKNTLFLYLLSEIGLVFFWFKIDDETLYQFLYSHFFKVIGGEYMGSLLFAISWMLVCWCVGLWMDRRKIYVTV